MRFMCVCAGLVALLVANAVPAFPQRMLEHAITAAGGSASGVAGKGVSEGINKIFGKLKSQSEKTTEAHISKRLTPQQASEAVDTPVETPALVEGAVRTRPVTAARRGEAEEQRPTASAPQEWWTTPVQHTVEPQVSLEDLEAVEAGTSRGELVARLGTPAARVMIPEDGELQEVYHFNSGGVHLGRVTLTNGAVANVEVDPTAR